MNSWLIEPDKERISPVIEGITITKYPAKILGLNIVPAATLPLIDWYIPVSERKIATKKTKWIKFRLFFLFITVVAK